MPRCEKHKELDRAYDIVEAYGQAHGIYASSTKRKMAEATYLLELIRDSEHSYNGFSCPDEED
jgi:hypothetical protein